MPRWADGRRSPTTGTMPDAVDAALDGLDARRRALVRGHGHRAGRPAGGPCARTTSAGKVPPPRTRPHPARCCWPRSTSRRCSTRRDARLAVAHAGRRPDEGLGRRPCSGWSTHGAPTCAPVVLDDTGQVVGVGREERRSRPAGCGGDLGAGRGHARPRRRRARCAAPTWTTSTPGATMALAARPASPTSNRPGKRWHNRQTSTSRWTVHRARDGTGTWPHRRHGWTIRLAPPRRDLTDVPDPGPPDLPPTCSNPPDPRTRLTELDARHPDCSVVRGDGAWSPAIDRVHVYDVGESAERP